MKYRKLGKTGIEVSCLSFGASSLGSVFRPIDESEGIRAVHAALDAGINYIDVSPFYGLTVAETVLGKALRGLPRNRYLLATKVGRYREDAFDFSRDRVKASVDESLARMNVEHIDVIQCHDIEYGSLDQVVEETIPALMEIKRQGKARFVGITGLPLKIFEYVLDRVEVDTILSYCHYSIHDTSLEALIPYLEGKGVGIISASPLSMGLLTGRGEPDWHPAPALIKKTCAKAAAHCRKRDVDIAKLALQFSLAEPRIHTTLVGTASPDNIRNNIKWIEEPLDEELLAEVQDILQPVRNYTWIVGRPENSGGVRGYDAKYCAGETP
jgi:aryl-alcohol dehydrogenase-like predicted oxidoreductase